MSYQVSEAKQKNYADYESEISNLKTQFKTVPNPEYHYPEQRVTGYYGKGIAKVSYGNPHIANQDAINSANTFNADLQNKISTLQTEYEEKKTKDRADFITTMKDSKTHSDLALITAAERTQIIYRASDEAQPKQKSNLILIGLVFLGILLSVGVLK